MIWVNRPDMKAYRCGTKSGALYTRAIDHLQHGVIDGVDSARLMTQINGKHSVDNVTFTIRLFPHYTHSCAGIQQMQASEHPSDRITRIITSGTPLIYVATWEEERLERMLEHCLTSAVRR